MKMRRAKAIVLRRTNYREADRIIDYITDMGRVSAIAKGARKEKSKLSGGVELFSLSDIVTGNGKGDLDILVSASLVVFYRHILDDYDRMQFAYEVLKVTAKNSQNIDGPDWFNIVSEVLAALDDTKISLQLVQVWFYVRVAEILGDELNLGFDADGHRLDSEHTYRYDSSIKTLVIDSSGSITANHIKLLRLISLKPINIVAKVGGVDQVLAECVYLARSQAAV